MVGLRDCLPRTCGAETQIVVDGTTPAVRCLQVIPRHVEHGVRAGNRPLAFAWRDSRTLRDKWHVACRSLSRAELRSACSNNVPRSGRGSADGRSSRTASRRRQGLCRPVRHALGESCLKK